MTKDWYKQQGYELSSLIEDSKIAVAEKIVKESYLLPLGIAEEGNEELIGALAYVWILTQNIFATRSGAKVKTSQYSASPYVEQLSAYKKRAVSLLSNQSQDLSQVKDVCELFFVKQFFYE